MLVQPQKWRVNLFARQLFEGAVIAYPTEGVWGLGCLPGLEEPVTRILRLKRRSWKKGLILVASRIEQILPYSDELTAQELAVLKIEWPGSVTYLLPRSKNVPDLIAGDSDRVAVRVSKHAVVKAICDELGGPMVSTSANPTGKIPAGSKLRLKQYFPSGIDAIFPGELGTLKGASEIRDLRTGEVIRAAAL
jgi:L-threonylcarbamoyladenylate synthase